MEGNSPWKVIPTSHRLIHNLFSIHITTAVSCYHFPLLTVVVFLSRFSFASKYSLPSGDVYVFFYLRTYGTMTQARIKLSEMKGEKGVGPLLGTVNGRGIIKANRDIIARPLYT